MHYASNLESQLNNLKTHKLICDYTFKNHEECLIEIRYICDKCGFMIVNHIHINNAIIGEPITWEDIYILNENYEYDRISSLNKIKTCDEQNMHNALG